MQRSEIFKALEPYTFIEIDQAREILAQSESEELRLDEARMVWDRVSVAIDHHLAPDARLLTLRVLESQLAQLAAYPRQPVRKRYIGSLPRFVVGIPATGILYQGGSKLVAFFIWALNSNAVAFDRENRSGRWLFPVDLFDEDYFLPEADKQRIDALEARAVQAERAAHVFAEQARYALESASNLLRPIRPVNGEHLQTIAQALPYVWSGKRHVVTDWVDSGIQDEYRAIAEAVTQRYGFALPIDPVEAVKSLLELSSMLMTPAYSTPVEGLKLRYPYEGANADRRVGAADA